MEIHMYGIPNCDTVKKAQQWLAKNNLQFVFHDYKKEGVTKTKLNGWCKAAGWRTVFNLRSSTWQALAKEGTTPPATQAEAVALMQEHHSIIKRPVLEVNNEIIVGFDEKQYFQKLVNQP